MYYTLYFWRKCRGELILLVDWLTLVEYYVSNEAYFKPYFELYPVSFFNLGVT